MNQKQTNPEPSGAPMAKVILVVAIIVSLGAVLGVIGYAVKNKAVVSQQPQVLLAIEPKPANQIIDDTADWKTYRNEEYGFQLEYPEGFSVVNLDQIKNNLSPFYQNWIQFIFEREYFGSPTTVVISDEYIHLIVVHINEKDEGSECSKNDFLTEGKMMSKEITVKEVIGESDFYKEEWREGADGSHFFNYRTVYNNKCFMMTTNLEDSSPNDPIKMELYDKIIHSFKFIEKETN